MTGQTGDTDLMTHLEEYYSERCVLPVMGQPDLTFEAGLNSDVFVDTSSFCDCLLALYHRMQ